MSSFLAAASGTVGTDDVRHVGTDDVRQAASNNLSCKSTWARLNNRVRARRPTKYASSTLLGKETLFSIPKPEELQHELLDLQKPFELSNEDIVEFRKRRYIRLKAVLPPGLLRSAKKRVVAMGTKATGGRDVSLPQGFVKESDGSQSDNDRYWREISEPNTRSWNIQMMWAVDPVVRALVLSPRVGDIVCKLLDCANVRLYHDNFLSRAPGSKRTLWHCDDGPNGYMALAGRQVVTVWFPLHHCTPENGSLIFPRMDAKGGVIEPKSCLTSWDVAKLDGCPLEEQSDEYDTFCAASLEQSGAFPEEATYEIGDISIHATDCYHSAGPNLTGRVRNIIAATYFADTTAMRTDKDFTTMTKGQRNDWQKFAPGVLPGEQVATRFNPLVPHCQ